MAATVDDARALEASGVDVLVVQGSEAGGHRSTWVKHESPQAACVGTMALVPEVVDSVRIPVVAPGAAEVVRAVLEEAMLVRARLADQG